MGNALSGDQTETGLARGRELLNTVVHDSRVIVVPPERFAEVGECQWVSFCGSPTTAPEGALDWVCGTPFREKWDDQDRKRFFQWLMCWTPYLNAAYGGFTLGVEENGQLIACATIRPSRTISGSLLPSVTMKIVRLFCFSDRLKDVPAWMKEGEPWKKSGPLKDSGVDERYTVVNEGMAQMHKENAPGPHYYVWVMAVRPDAQGKKGCSSLMRCVSAMADADKVPCYLETFGERNIAIYNHLGYTQRKDYTFDDPKGEEPPLVYTALIRLPAQTVT